MTDKAKRISWVAIPLLTLSLVLFLGHSILLRSIAQFLVAQDAPQPADAIILIGRDKTGGRVEHAVDLFRQGMGKYLIIAGWNIGWRTNSADIMKQHVMALGVPLEAILVDREGIELADKAHHVRELMQKESLKRAILVTSMYNSARAMIVFRSVLSPVGITVISNPTQASGFDPANWWRSRKGAKIVVSEYLQRAWYLPDEEE